MAATPVEGAVGGEELRRSLSERPPRKILVQARDHIGDAINTTGALASIIKRFPEAHVTLEVGEGAAAVFEGFPGLRKLWPRKKHQGIHGKVGFSLKLRKAAFDLAVILDDSNEKIRLTAMGGVPLRVGVRKTKHFELFTASVPFDREAHDIFSSLQRVLELLGCDPDVAPRVYPSAEDRTAALHALQSSGVGERPIVGLHVGASEERKMWPAESFGKVARMLRRDGVSPLLLAGPRESDLLDAAGARELPSIEQPLSILQYAALMEHLASLVTADTGPAHVAGATRLPAVVLYGPTDPQRFHPYGRGHKLLYHSYGCAFYDGLCAAESEGKRCDHRCMRSIKPEEVVDAVHQILEART